MANENKKQNQTNKMKIMNLRKDGRMERDKANKTKEKRYLRKKKKGNEKTENTQ